MVTANCRKKMPTGPVMNATGTNTAVIISVMAMMAPLISPAPAHRAIGREVLLAILACTASTTTMALSTTMPMAKHQGEQGDQVDGHAHHLQHGERARPARPARPRRISVDRQSPGR